MIPKMAIITFLNNKKEETGKTLSIAAIATYMSIEHNAKHLIMTTGAKEDRMKLCFWKEKKKSKVSFGIFGPNKNNLLDEQSGITGLVKMAKSNKITPEIITNYTRVVFKDRLEILLGPEQISRDDIYELYPDILTIANQYYDRIFVDLDNNVSEKVFNKIVNMSDIIVVNLNQRFSSIEDFKQKKEEKAELQSAKILILIGRYDKYSKYNIKNITRYLKEKNNILTIPYNTLFFEATEEAGVPDLFLKFKKFIDPEDRNAFFVEEVKRASENIIYRIQNVQTGL